MAEIPEKPRKSAADVAYTITKAAVSAVPVAGGPAAEVLGLIFGPPLEKRREKWIGQLADAVKEVQEKVADLTPEKLSKDEAFVTAALHATQIALRTHQQEKLQVLRNAVVNAARGIAPQDDLRAIFLSLVDTFTPRHINILKFFENRSSLDPSSLQQLRNARVLTDLMVNDLARYGLIEDHRPYAARGRDTGNSLLVENWTLSTLGAQFISFISSSASASH